MKKNRLKTSKNCYPKIREHIKASYPHFRYYKKSKHPALITGETTEYNRGLEYKYRKVMHSAKDGRRANECVTPNPNPRDKEPMYIGKRVKHDVVGAFEDNPLPWEYKKK